MKNSLFSSQHKFLHALLKVSSILLTLILLWYWVIERPYRQFREDEEKNSSRLRQLNDSLLAQIPPPAGAAEVERSYAGGGWNHGYELFVTYQLQDDANAVEQGLAYYDDFLMSGDWKMKQVSYTTRLYYRDLTCVEFHANPNSNQKTYYIVIWHDYLGLDFTPKPPHPWVMFVHEPVYGRFLQCPPADPR